MKKICSLVKSVLESLAMLKALNISSRSFAEGKGSSASEVFARVRARRQNARQAKDIYK